MKHSRVHAKLWILSSAAIMVLLIAVSLWLPFRMTVNIGVANV